MATVWCLYCATPTPPEDQTREHVIPYALGGTLTIGGVCKRCNSDLGSALDAALLLLPQVSEPAARLGLTARSRTPRPIVRDRRARIIGGLPPEAQAANVRMDLTVLGPGQFDAKLITTRVGADTYLVSVKEIARFRREQLAAARRRHGPHVLVALEEWPLDGPEPLTVEVQSPVEGQLVSRALAKIALGYLSATLGQTTALLPTFDALRAYVCTGAGQLYGTELLDEATLTGELGAPRDQHVLSLFMAESWLCCWISLFGTAGCILGLGEGLPPSSTWPVGWETPRVLDPLARSSPTRAAQKAADAMKGASQRIPDNIR